MTKKLENWLLAASLLALASSTAWANLKLPRLVSDHMVMQRNKQNKLWGWAKPGAKLTITLGKQVLKTTATKDGRWQTMLAPVGAGGPYTITVTDGKETKTVNDVLFGEVWVASGQSNMEWKMKQQITNMAKEIAAANHPQIRAFEVINRFSSKPMADVDSNSRWMVCNPALAPEFSAVAYFYAREIHEKLRVPVGILQCEWGGTPAEAWTSYEGLKAIPFLKAEAESAEKGDYQQESAVYKATFATFWKEAEKRDKGMKEKWTKPTGVADSTWNRIELPGLIEEQGFAGENGCFYLRNKVNIIGQFNKGGDVTIQLGRIDDIDSVFINGVNVGGREGYDRLRSYTFSAKLLNEGENSIVIKMLDLGGEGGIRGAENEMRLMVGNVDYPLAGGWRIAKGFDMAGMPPYPKSTSMQNKPGALYYGMLQPLMNYTIQGVIWYQGESNAGRAWEYRTLFPAMITDWRKNWGLGDFPFYYVQLTSYRQPVEKPGPSEWAELREAQMLTLKLPNTGMAVITDIGDANDIHPRNKKDVGMRLAIWARYQTYGEEALIYRGPVFKSVDYRGSLALVKFEDSNAGMYVKDKYGYVKGFELAGADGVFHFAQGTLSGNVVTLVSSAVREPKYVRFAWSNNVDDANLFNASNLPAWPFRTDDFPLSTQK